MRYVRAALARLAGVFAGHRADDDLRDELQSHLEMETAENIRRGMHPDEARRRALLGSGGLTQAVEAIRDQRGLPWVEGIAADIRYAVRALSHSRAFSVVVLVTLALGIGANTAIFSVVRGVLLKPLPHRDGDRLIYLRQSADGDERANLTFSVPEVREFRAGVPSLGGIAEYSSWFGTLQGDNVAVRMDMGLVTGNFFEVMGLAPVLGRVTEPSDDGIGVPPVMVLTHEFWIRRFGGDSAVVGKQVRLDGNSVTVIGVLQPAPFFPDRVDALLNMVVSPHHTSAFMVQNRSHRMTEMIARLAPGATMAQARSEVAAVYGRMLREHTEAYDAGSHPRVAVIPFKEALGERARPTLWLLMGAAAFVLIISAANVANLTLMRGVRREHELVVRAALGAGVSRLRRLLLVENLVLTLLGAVLGVVIAIGGVRLLTSFVARTSARASEIRLDGMVLGFTLALSVALALLLSLVASLPKEGTFASMSAGARRITGNLSKHRLLRALVVAQIAVSVVLLAGAGLLTRTMIQLSQVDTGLRTEEVLTLPVPLLNPTRISPEADAASKQLYERMRSEIRALPGVIEVGVGSTMPLRTSQVALDVSAEGKALAVGEATPRADLRTAGPEYFRAAGITLLTGREFEITDQSGAAKVVIINQALVNRFFPGEDPIGKRIAWTGEVLKFTPFSGDWRTIVGVVGNTQDGGLDAEPQPVVFMPFAQEFAIGGGLVIRADSNVAALAGAATRIVRRIAPTIPIENVLTVAQIKDQSVAPRRLNAALVSAFGLLAVIIAAVGIAGVLAFSVSARTTELGIRMSLGADSGMVQRMILREGGVLLAMGLVLGVAGAVFAGRVIRGLLFGVAPHDPTTLIGVAAMMAAIGIGACWIPARRAARIDPAITMRG
ncbi:MAG: ABC transporter permease [Gemmatimonadota bacterium]|nr:ABC transporter permease [Gemmatimonadota bacterium]MDZ4863837.1 ABC transporter permease [Gemmatimonadota bacterium]